MRLFSGMKRFCSLCQKMTEHHPVHGDGCVAWICSQHSTGEVLKPMHLESD